ncbi:hypothetical protein ABIB40_001679 [Pedobacter sp. UYP30]|uniref:hypothetical protein n=1 Tax=Pedobacter sp. UYP30 TaxID=1756400 RepID=UPI00339720BD
MTGIVLQFISLVTYANDYLANDRLPDSFYPEHIAFRFCDSVIFKDFRKNSPKAVADGKLVATDPKQWFLHLKQRGCKKLRLYFQYSNREGSPPDYKTAGMVGGGGFWRIEAQYENRYDSWASRWEVTQKDDPQRNIWSVTYGLLHSETAPTELPCNLDVIKKVSLERFSAIKTFAKEQKLDSWHNIFEDAYAMLNSTEPAKSGFNMEMIPSENYSLIAKQLLFAADKAWVFGGMGSWNDLNFEKEADQELYEELSYQLYDNLCVNVLSAVNSY